MGDVTFQHPFSWRFPFFSFYLFIYLFLVVPAEFWGYRLCFVLLWFLCISANLFVSWCYCQGRLVSVCTRRTESLLFGHARKVPFGYDVSLFSHSPALSCFSSLLVSKRKGSELLLWAVLIQPAMIAGMKAEWCLFQTQRKTQQSGSFLLFRQTSPFLLLSASS
ncbi:hypothetical protein CPSG_01727 [Coccidioides posadasii str. Silveira]|uniref:Uncharacterized protein n=1 Tax=Coccidioides posadasii (strain RMSCC 757 / Silveira) TaxID=443226 RepID=E9CW94_COCPS|nr:hypothetical protein CPSG_01727 [Coccidioides posadasii str. Silveira]